MLNCPELKYSLTNISCRQPFTFHSVDSRIGVKTQEKHKSAFNSLIFIEQCKILDILIKNWVLDQKRFGANREIYSNNCYHQCQSIFIIKFNKIHSEFMFPLPLCILTFFNVKVPTLSSIICMQNTSTIKPTKLCKIMSWKIVRNCLQ